MTKNNLCIIPARGGSKRIPRKNIKEFLGKPIISYSIEAALTCGLFSEVMVSTDDEEIASISREWGASVPFKRSISNSDDHSSTLDVLKEVLKEYEKLNLRFDKFCCLYPTAPFVTRKRLIESFNLMVENGYDSVLPVLPYSFPIQRSFSITNDNTVKYMFEEFKNSRSQDLVKTYHDAGQFYWCEQIIGNGDSIVTGNTGCIEIGELEGQDIDNYDDWKIAEIKYEILQSSK